MLVISYVYAITAYITTPYSIQQRENFKSSGNSIGVQSQLRALAQIVKIVDPKLHRHLGKGFLFSVYSSVVISIKEVKNARSCQCC